MWQPLLQSLLSGEIKALARAISLIENEAAGYEDFLAQLPDSNALIIGITGPPGAGKSTLTDALTAELIQSDNKIAILCIDPSSPFNMGALLGDRVRMSRWYNHQNVFIRSLATRGSLGGLHAKIIEITAVVKAAGYDYVLIETVGVGQSEIEIAGLADITIVTIVPEAGDEIQTMKAGLMEIADIFVVNKADRPGADEFVKNLRQMLAPTFATHQQEVPVIKTVASKQEGVHELKLAIESLAHQHPKEHKGWLLAERAYQLIQKSRMTGISKADLKKEIDNSKAFNLYQFVKKYM